MTISTLNQVRMGKRLSVGVNVGNKFFWNLVMLIAATTLIAAATAAPAHAYLEICNKSSYDVDVTVGYEVKSDWTSEGWWQIDRNECVRVIDGSLRKQFYYIYAVEAPSGDYKWSGDYFFCVSDDEFTIVGDSECKSRGYYAVGYFEIDVGDYGDWTQDLID